MTPSLETPRLVLRPIALDDAPAFQRLFAQWRVVEYMGAEIPWPFPDDGALCYIRDSLLPGMAARTRWDWSIRPRSDPDRMIGKIGLHLGEDDNRGFWIDPDWQGRGLAGEASEAVTDFWFDILGQQRLRVPKAIANAASRAISQRSGMRVIWSGERDYVSGRHASELWEITADEWRNRNA